MIRKKKLFVRPKKAYEKQRISEENSLKKRYALKNKREIWKSQSNINYYRSRAKALAKSSLDEQKILFGKLTALGIKVNSIADVLALKIENLLDRRLSTVVYNKGLAKTARQARQMITHKQVSIDGKVVNSPSYIVLVSEENSITLKISEKPKVNKSENKEGESAQ